MNREIKFRAWDKKYGTMIIVLKLNTLFESPEGIMVKGVCDCNSITQDHENHEHEIMPEDLELMQFTGLKDKNGKEIYEGDIVLVDWNDKRYEPHNVEVVWNEKELAWEIEGGCLTTDNHHFEVIGNRYENPELITNTPSI